MTNSTLRGVIAAIATPFDAKGEPDLGRFVRLAQHLLANGCDALNVCGTTGEATSMSVPQRKSVMETAARHLPRERLMVGTGAAAVADAAALTAYAGELGFAGTLLLPPFYYKGVSDDGVAAYVERVAAAAPTTMPLYLYHFPALSGVPFHPALVARLRESLGPRLAGLKDSSGDMDYARSVAAALPGFDVFPSNEAVLGEARSGAFAGCISATANVNAAFCAAAWRDGDVGALEKAVAIRTRISRETLVPAVKSVLAKVLGDESYARVLPPLAALEPAQVERLIDDLPALAPI
jgi:4-hydroxy-tetrahydrodipicolinate synthase